MTTLTLTPKMQISAPQVPARLSLRRVLWYRVLRWIEKASLRVILNTLVRVASMLLVVLLIFVPQFAIGYLTAVLQWNSYRIPIFLSAFALMLNAKRLWRLLRARPRAGNQHTFHGIPVPELADLLIETGGFRREDTKRVALSQGQHQKIGEELEKYQVLMRGENNARVLAPITREELARQLTEDFPLRYDPERKIWAERDGTFDRWVLQQEFKTRRIAQEEERKEKKLERLQERIEETGALLGALEAIPAQ